MFKKRLLGSVAVIDSFLVIASFQSGDMSVTRPVSTTAAPEQ